MYLYQVPRTRGVVLYRSYFVFLSSSIRVDRNSLGDGRCDIGSTTYLPLHPYIVLWFYFMVGDNNRGSLIVLVGIHRVLRIVFPVIFLGVQYGWKMFVFDTKFFTKPVRYVGRL